MTQADEKKSGPDSILPDNENLANLLVSIDLPTLFLDCELRIKFFTPASCRLFSLIPSDIGRPIGNCVSKVDLENLITVARQVQSSRLVVEDEVRTFEGDFYLRRVLPHRIKDHIEGVVVILVPINTLKRSEKEARESEKRFRALADNVPVFIWISGLGGKLEFVNQRLPSKQEVRLKSYWVRNGTVLFMPAISPVIWRRPRVRRPPARALITNRDYARRMAPTVGCDLSESRGLRENG